MSRRAERSPDHFGSPISLRLDTYIEEILAADPAEAPGSGRETIGRSREGRPIHAWCFGRADLRISLVGGCHADEPVGPRLLRRLVAFLGTLEPEHPLLADHEWWVIPHINPDGEERNRSWQDPGTPAYDIARYLSGAIRERPGDDIEFGFPRDLDDREARPENRAAYEWWRAAGGPFRLHASLHGMAVAAGPWFLIEAAWRKRAGPLMQRCRERTAELGYALHDVERGGEKGFHRLARGFTTRPDSGAMRAHFEALDDPDTAARFRPSSMETIRALGGDALTLVSEMPLFITPGVGEELGPPDPAALRWKERIDGWRRALAHGAPPDRIRDEAAAAGLRPMPVADQMRLIWSFVTAGVEVGGRRDD